MAPCDELACTFTLAIKFQFSTASQIGHQYKPDEAYILYWTKRFNLQYPAKNENRIIVPLYGCNL